MKGTSFKEKIILIGFSALVLVAVLHYSDIYKTMLLVLSSMNALFIGAIFAFILNVPMKKLEQALAPLPVLGRKKRPLAIIGVLIIFSLIVTGVVLIIWPTLVSTVSQLVSVANQAIPQLIKTLQESGFLSSKLGSQLNDYVIQLTDWSKLSSLATVILTGLANNVTGIFSNVFTLIVAFFFTLTILGSKEHLQSMTLKMLYASFPETVVARIVYVGQVVSETYDRFLMGQMIEATIIGTLVFSTYSLFSIPYAGMAGVLSGVLSFVPYIGPFSACMISALFISVQSPWLALGSILLFQLLQLIEGNVIYPRVVGQSVGLPTLVTLAAALIGGNLFGLLGMVFFTPLFGVIYRLVKEWAYARLEVKQINMENITKKIKM